MGDSDSNSNSDFISDAVVSLLTEGLETAAQLKTQLKPPPAVSSEICQALLDKILSSYDNALKQLAFLGQGRNSQSLIINPDDCPNSPPLSHEIGRRPPPADNQRPKKRKTLQKWNKQVKVGGIEKTGSGLGLESQLQDGYSWRKYGQKNILGCTNPRAYYRCTHRNTQGCLATKHVQRGDDDPSLYEISYQGKHTCVTVPKHSKNNNNLNQPQPQPQPPQTTTFIVNNPNPNPDQQQLIAQSESPYSYPSTQTESERMSFFPDPFLLSPATSDSNYFSLSECNVDDFGLTIPNSSSSLQEDSSDVAEIISNPNPNSNLYPLAAGDDEYDHWDFSITPIDFDSHFFDAFDQPESLVV
ncbi:transcription factor WRKY19-like [Andrographis paniculata]|uniref:transcription factor WRKY19-like n=1 Tax=Andrographis paniculata TaxID=175694 RepID=UPI0021E80100|nr:transcription factor WRKY19-like [Andrographis paniculata]